MKKSERLAASRERWASIRAFGCGCRLVDGALVPVCTEHLCERVPFTTDACTFPVGRVVHQTPRNAVDLNAAFTRALARRGKKRRAA